MSTYTYRCTACEYEYNQVKKMVESDPVTCPRCREEELRQVITSLPFHLKGSGWYETDFK